MPSKGVPGERAGRKGDVPRTRRAGCALEMCFCSTCAWLGWMRDVLAGRQSESVRDTEYVKPSIQFQGGLVPKMEGGFPSPITHCLCHPPLLALPRTSPPVPMPSSQRRCASFSLWHIRNLASPRSRRLSTSITGGWWFDPGRGLPLDTCPHARHTRPGPPVMVVGIGISAD